MRQLTIFGVSQALKFKDTRTQQIVEGDREKALEERLEREELKEDLLDFKMLGKDEDNAVSLEEYLTNRLKSK